MGHDRGILKNSTSLVQSYKTLEELSELINALSEKSLSESVDSYGDIVVTLIIGAKILGYSLVDCLDSAFCEIADRKGHLREDGIFVKEEN